jgi:molybdopterin molybdotransferase
MRRTQGHRPAHSTCATTLTLPLTEALARVLAQDVTSPLDVPGHTNSAVDGFALCGQELPATGEHTLHLIGHSFAGNPYSGSVVAGQCVRIMTGAIMPAGTDTVVMLEHAHSQDHGQNHSHSEGQSDTDRTHTTVRIASGHRAGQNVRQAGEDLRAGQLMLTRGTRLMPAALGMLASVGIAEVSVTRALRVAFFSTGDELRSLGEPLDIGQVYDSNRYTLRGMLMRLGVEFIDMGIVRDDPEQLRSALDDACAQADVVITSGGVSTGDADYIKDLLQTRGQMGFWRIAVRPGRPLAFGLLPNGPRDTVFFGLPGNPVAVMVTFYQFVQPALLTMMGSQAPPPVPLLDARCPDALRKKPGRVEYYRAILSRDTDGLLQVRPTGSTGSGLLHTMNDANCLIVLADELHDMPANSIVQVQPFFAMV